MGWVGLDKMHTCLHAGETAPKGKRKTIDETAHKAARDKNSFCPVSINIGKKIFPEL